MQKLALLTLADIAAAGVAPNSIRRARLDPTSRSYRKPPANWRAALAKLARERDDELVELANELDAESR